MAPKDDQVLIPGTHGWTSYGKRDFADVLKRRLWRWGTDDLTGCGPAVTMKVLRRGSRRVGVRASRFHPFGPGGLETAELSHSSGGPRSRGQQRQCLRGPASWLCVCALCRDCCFLVALRRGWQALAQLGTCLVGCASRPSHLVHPGTASPDPVPALSLSLLPLSWAPCSAHRRSHLHGNCVRSTGLTAARGREGRKGAHASQPLSGTHTSRHAVSLAEPLAAEGGRSWSSWGEARLVFQGLLLTPRFLLVSCPPLTPCLKIPVPLKSHPLPVKGCFFFAITQRGLEGP